MFSFGLWVDQLSKAVGHKYIKRIPYTVRGKRRYRYIYKVTHSHQGRHAFDEAHLQEGTAFSLNTKAGEEFHGHITKIKGDKVSYRIDDGPEKGTIKTTSKRELLAKLNDVHDIENQLTSERDKLRNQIKEARENKASEKQIARLESRLKRLGEKQEPEKQEPEVSEKKPKLSAFDIFTDEDMDEGDLESEKEAHEKPLADVVYKLGRPTLKKLIQGEQIKSRRKREDAFSLLNNLSYDVGYILGSEKLEHVSPLDASNFFERVETFARQMGARAASPRDNYGSDGGYLRAVMGNIAFKLLEQSDLKPTATRAEFRELLINRYQEAVNNIKEARADREERERQRQEDRKRQEEQQRQKEADVREQMRRRAEEMEEAKRREAEEKVAGFEDQRRNPSQESESTRKELREFWDDKEANAVRKIQSLDTQEIIKDLGNVDPQTLSRFSDLETDAKKADKQDFTERDVKALQRDYGARGASPSDVKKFIGRTKQSLDDQTVYNLGPHGKVAVRIFDNGRLGYQYKFPDGDVSDVMEIKDVKQPITQATANRIAFACVANFFGGVVDGDPTYYPMSSMDDVTRAKKDHARALKLEEAGIAHRKFSNMLATPYEQTENPPEVPSAPAPSRTFDPSNKTELKELMQFSDASRLRRKNNHLGAVVVGENYIGATDGTRLILKPTQKNEKTGMFDPKKGEFTGERQPPMEAVLNKPDQHQHVATLTRQTMDRLIRVLKQYPPKANLSPQLSLVPHDGGKLGIYAGSRRIATVPASFVDGMTNRFQIRAMYLLDALEATESDRLSLSLPVDTSAPRSIGLNDPNGTKHVIMGVGL
jgi:hypothetical protein